MAINDFNVQLHSGFIEDFKTLYRMRPVHVLLRIQPNTSIYIHVYVCTCICKDAVSGIITSETTVRYIHKHFPESLSLA